MIRDELVLNKGLGWYFQGVHIELFWAFFGGLDWAEEIWIIDWQVIGPSKWIKTATPRPAVGANLQKQFCGGRS